MSRMSFELLMNFIQRNEIWSIISICNEYLSFDIHPEVQTALRPLDALLMKDTGDEGLQANQRDVNLGLLKGCLEDTLVAQAVNELQQVRKCCKFLQMQGLRTVSEILLPALQIVKESCESRACCLSTAALYVPWLELPFSQVCVLWASSISKRTYVRMLPVLVHM
jgi:hypothetical protein